MHDSVHTIYLQATLIPVELSVNHSSLTSGDAAGEQCA